MHTVACVFVNTCIKETLSHEKKKKKKEVDVMEGKKKDDEKKVATRRKEEEGAGPTIEENKQGGLKKPRCLNGERWKKWGLKITR